MGSLGFALVGAAHLPFITAISNEPEDANWKIPVSSTGRPDAFRYELRGIMMRNFYRLTLEFASQESQLFPWVYYVSLAPLNSADYALQVIADGVGYTVSGLTDLKGQLFNYLHGLPKPAILLVLDNLEHLLQDADRERSVAMVTLIAEMLRRLPKLSILIASREWQGLQGEWTFELSGLPGWVQPAGCG